MVDKHKLVAEKEKWSLPAGPRGPDTPETPFTAKRFTVQEQICAVFMFMRQKISINQVFKRQSR